MRTNGGELIPESGVFVKINKVEVEEVQTSSLRSGKLRRQTELSFEDDPRTLSVIAENEEELQTPDDIDVLESINPLAFGPRRSKPPASPNARPVSSPPLLEATNWEEVDGTNKVEVMVELNSVPEVEKAVAMNLESKALETLSLSKPRSFIIEANPESNVHINEEGLPVGVEEAESVKEYHLQVRSQRSQEEDQY